MLPYKRSQRVADLIREEIAMIIMRRVKDPRLSFITVTSVRVSEDLKLAKVYVSVLNRKETGRSVELLNAARGFIRSELSKNVKLKYIPQLEFFNDSSIEYGERIDYLLDRISEES
ncbi:ribosome-binding factor A [bacterium BMS3Abin07]|nr:ribosome-binding factor A [bacterium BMS3Abin07]GBE32851.1 ribosome-binding factor A [bacterium BMS3Bbin05]HDO22401.1 30S ribosome-binding factor RbfA [Nitrospirota bacterium]HDZ88817.1 30S ribosome-binding factor RbfA [Nitrospirota bacterium]